MRHLSRCFAFVSHINPWNAIASSTLSVLLCRIYHHAHFFRRYSFFQPLGFLCFVLARIAALQWLFDLTKHSPRDTSLFTSSLSSDSPQPPDFHCNSRRVLFFIVLAPVFVSILARWAGALFPLQLLLLLS
jgi:hypothetical protein